MNMATVNLAASRPADAFAARHLAAGLRLRPEASADRAFLFDLHAGFRSEEMALVPWSVSTRRTFLDEQFRLQRLHFTRHHPDADFWIVERSKSSMSPRSIGRLYLDRSGATWRILDIGLVPETRGKGLGSLLLGHVQRAAAAAGVSAVDLHVALGNPRARSLYARLGFVDRASSVATHCRMEWRPPSDQL